MADESGKGNGGRKPWGSNNFRPGVTGADQALLEELHGILEASGEVSGSPTASNIFSFMCRMVREQMVARGHLEEPKERSVDDILSEGRKKRDQAKAREKEQAAQQQADQGNAGGGEADKSGGAKNGESGANQNGEDSAGSGEARPPEVPQLAKPVEARELERREEATKDSECASLNCQVMIETRKPYDWHPPTKQAFCVGCGDALRAAA